MIGATLATACACAPTRNDSNPKTALDEPQSGDTAEWVFATEGLNSERPEECRHVHEWLKKEAGCQGQTCVHGQRLARDWLSLCRQASPGAVSDVESLRQRFEQRAGQLATPCDEQLEQQLRDGCAPSEPCLQRAEQWATRCAASVRSPLSLLMLERTVQQSGQATGRVRLDPRSCEDLADEVRSAAACTKRFDCEDQRSKVQTYRDRCMNADAKPVPPSVGLWMLAVAVGAETAAEPLVVSAEPAKLPRDAAPLVFESATGAVLAACGERPTDLESYLAARASCRDGDITIAGLVAGPGTNRTWRVGRLSHPDDETFWQRFPSLVVFDEASAREQIAEQRFTARLDEAAHLGGASDTVESGIARLCDTLLEHRRWLSREPAMRDALAQRDLPLVPMFSTLGKLKGRLLDRPMRAGEVTPFARRAQGLALADVDALGHVQLGAATLAASVDAESVLPRSMDAYREALDARLRRASAAPLRASATDRILGRIREQASACGKAKADAATLEQSLVACALGTESCPGDRSTVLETELGRAREKWDSAYLQVTLARAELGDAQSADAKSILAKAGCSRP